MNPHSIWPLDPEAASESDPDPATLLSINESRDILWSAKFYQVQYIFKILAKFHC
jgi:hypothetical protein